MLNKIFGKNYKNALLNESPKGQKAFIEVDFSNHRPIHEGVMESVSVIQRLTFDECKNITDKDIDIEFDVYEDDIIMRFDENHNTKYFVYGIMRVKFYDRPKITVLKTLVPKVTNDEDELIHLFESYFTYCDKTNYKDSLIKDIVERISTFAKEFERYWNSKYDMDIRTALDKEEYIEVPIMMVNFMESSDNFPNREIDTLIDIEDLEDTMEYKFGRTDDD